MASSSSPPASQLPPIEWGTTALPSDAIETTIALAQRELFVYWSCTRFKPLPLNAAGQVQKRALRLLNDQLISPEPALGEGAQHETPRLHFTRLMLQALGLCVRANHHLRAAGGYLTPPAFWSRSALSRTRTCLEAWLRLPEWSELSTLGMATFDLDLAQARRLLLGHLCQLQSGTWLSAERFLERVSVLAPRLIFQKEDKYPGIPYFKDANYLTQQARWVAEVEAAFVGGVLSGPLHWLGLVDVCLDEGRLLAFRLTEDADRAMRLDEPLPSSNPAAVADGRLVVQPNFQLLALGGVPETTLARIELFADRVRADRGSFEFKLSRQTFYAAQQRGLSARGIIDFLQRQAGAPLPQNVLRTLREWGEQSERIVIRPSVALCHTDSAALADSLWQDPALKPVFERRLGPGMILLKRGNTATLRELLLERGQLPAVTRGLDPDRAKVAATPDGTLSLAHEGPDLLLTERLAELADEVDGRYVVTRSSVERSLERGLTVAAYLERLGAIHCGPLPPELVLKIKAWGRYYGSAVLSQVVLLEVKDRATADELLADPEMAARLARFDGDTTGRLLLVKTQEMDGLRRCLEERGINLSLPGQATG